MWSATRASTDTARRAAALGGGALVLAMLLGAAFSAPGYDSLRHTTSHLAGQGMPAAWIMRAGFLLYGLAVVTVARHAGGPAAGRLALAAFGAGFWAVTVWPACAPLPGMACDPGADALHSAFAGAMGLAYACAVALALFGPQGRARDTVGWLALVSSVAIPLAMLSLPDLAGLLQRIMFALSAVWLWRRAGVSRE